MKKEVLEIISSFASNEFDELKKILNRHQMYCALIYDEKVVWRNSHGIKRRENAVDIRLNSISKFYTSLLCLIAVSERKISLDSPITQFFSDLRLLYKNENMSSDITIRMLLEHSSGLIKDAKTGNNFNFCNDPQEYIDSQKDQNLLFKPGTNCKYSNIGYNLCGIILCQIYDMCFEDLVKWKLNNKRLSFDRQNLCMAPSAGMTAHIDDVVDLFIFGITTLKKLSATLDDNLFTKYDVLWSGQECGYGLTGKVYYCGNNPYMLSTGTDYENYLIQTWSPTHKFGGIMWTQGNVNEVIDAFENNDIFFNILSELENNSCLSQKKQIRSFPSQMVESYISYEDAMLYVVNEEQRKILISFDKKEWITLYKEGNAYINDETRLTFVGRNELRLDGAFHFGYYFKNNLTCEYSEQIEELCERIYSIESEDEGKSCFTSNLLYYRKFVRIYFSYSNNRLLLNRMITLKRLGNNKYQLPNGILMLIEKCSLWIGNLKFIRIK